MMTLRRFLVTWAMLFICIILDVGGIFIIKMHINIQGPIPIYSAIAILVYFLSLLKYPIVILGLIMFISAPFFYTVALTRMDISTAYPVQIGLNMALLVILAVIFLGEPLGFFKLFGLVLITASLFFLMD